MKTDCRWTRSSPACSSASASAWPSPPPLSDRLRRTAAYATATVMGMDTTVEPSMLPSPIEAVPVMALTVLMPTSGLALPNGMGGPPAAPVKP